MYTGFYGFKEKPFTIVSDPGFLYLSAKHRMALTYVEYGLMDGLGFILLTGEIGTGKTTLVKSLLKKIRSEMDVAVVFNTNVSAEELLVLIMEEFEMEVPPGGKAAYLDALNQFFVEKYAQGRRVLLIVDEAQNLSHEALEEVRMLSNLQTDKASLVQILLVGQPGLKARLQEPGLDQLSQRIAVRYHLRPLDRKETGDYIAHRLKIAGAPPLELFSSRAVDKIFEYSGGIPRMINIVCDAALVYGYADELSVIDEKVVESVIQDRQEAGMARPVFDASKESARESGPADQDGLAERIDRLEKQVQHLSALMDWQIKSLERQAEGYKDTLVERLEALLAKERRRVDQLMIQYNLLKERLNLKILKRADRQTSKAASNSAAGLSRSDTRQESGLDFGSERRPGRIRRWFSR